MPQENNENHKNIRIPVENYETTENIRFPRRFIKSNKSQNSMKELTKIIVILEVHARSTKIAKENRTP